MSDCDVIVISSDEDSGSVKFSKEKEPTHNPDIAHISSEKVQNSDWDEISLINTTQDSANTTCNEIKNKNFIDQSDHSSLGIIKTEKKSDDNEVIENNLCGNESAAFKKFMSTVLSAEEEEEVKTKLLKKLSKYHTLADQCYTSSSEFHELLEKGIEKINKNPIYLYFVLKEVKDSLISNRVEFRYKNKITDQNLSSGEITPQKSCQANCSVNENVVRVNEDARNNEIVEKLTSLLRHLENKIKELEEMEVDFSDEEDSSYFRMQRYRERYCQVYKKLCTYTNQPLNANRVGGFRKINFSDTDNLELNRAIEKWLNKTKQFPDYSDVNKLINELNQSLNLKLSKEQAKTKALQVFEKIGNMLQRRRHFDLWDSLSSFLDTDIDPAVKDPELESVLQKNFEMGVKKEKELLSYYVEMQEREKLQPVEVPDEEANCSPTESGDEDEKEIENVENILDTKISSDDDEGDTNNDDNSGDGDEDEDEDEDEVEVEVEIEVENENENENENDEKDAEKDPENGAEKDAVKDEGKDAEKDPGNGAEKDAEKDEENYEKSNEESKSGDGSTCHTVENVITIEEDSGKMDVNPETEVEGNEECQRNPVPNESSEQIDVRIDSRKTETTAGTKTGTKSAKDANVVGVAQSSQNVKDNPDLCRSKSMVKRKNENVSENGNETTNVNSLKRLSEDKGTREAEKSFKKSKLIKESDSDSDCEIIEIIPDKKAKSKNASSLERKVYQINYAFINNTFNYNTILSKNIFRKRHFSSIYKNMKNQLPHSVLPLTDLTNIKSIINKYCRSKENKMKKKTRNVLSKPKFLSAINCQPLNGSNLNHNNLPISLDKNSINCALQQETNAENTKSQKEADRANEKNDYQRGSSDDSAKSPTNGGSGGGSGQDNGENNGNKKPYDQEKQTDDNQDNEEKEDNEEEDGDCPENKLPETSEATESVPILFGPGTETYQNEPNNTNTVLNTAQINLPSTGKTAPTKKKSTGKQWGKNSGSENPKRTGGLYFPPTSRAPTARTPAARRRNLNQNGGIPARYRQANFNASAARGRNVSAESAKQAMNKPNPAKVISTATPSTDDDVEIIQVNKKKRSTPVKTTQSDEEIVKNFLQRSHPSISITTPKKRAVQIEPSPSVLQALETLSRLKGISTTIVKGSSKCNTDEDVTVISESLSTRVNQISKMYGSPKPSTTATASSSEPFIPKIVTVQGNVAGFDSITNESGPVEQNMYPFIPSPQAAFPSASGNPNNYEENFTGAVEGIPIPRFRNVKSRSRRTPKNKTKNIEYIVLD